ncbi:hypothetical protein [Fimbriimonas ginsengisoli]|uniref:Uncharacterized protein n=1 Tax=Fimbriimonas ginsengisoli Gsoil 348 TaxID=661478 RepID=A0A068NVD9_FIMGI|nr:hypothetical protein [Fimbriimonas ginsengisoli]AIE87488.1 hypothetical protein OP10G_4120 [Fimbriimonas ginsengisoli Gsoil 348]
MAVRIEKQIGLSKERSAYLQALALRRNVPVEALVGTLVGEAIDELRGKSEKVAGLVPVEIGYNSLATADLSNWGPEDLEPNPALYRMQGETAAFGE